MHRLLTTSSRSLRRADQKAALSLARGAHKETKFSNKGRASVLKGVHVCAISVTVGPKGRNDIIEKSFDDPKIVSDGMTIGKSNTLKDKFENFGPGLVQDVRRKTNEIPDI